MDNQKIPAAGGLRKKLFLLCSLLVITASLAFAVIGIWQLRASSRVASETNASQNEAIKLSSQETLTRQSTTFLISKRTLHL